MSVKRIRFIKQSGTHVLPQQEIQHYYVQPQEQFIQMFLPQSDDYSYKVVPESEPADICFYSVQHKDENLLRNNELNIFFSIENLRHNGKRGGKYAYFNKFGDYGSKKTNIFFMNDESYEYRGSDKIVIPVIHARLSYFNRFKQIVHLPKEKEIPFSEKKFALMITQNTLNPNKRTIFNALTQIGGVDQIQMFPYLKTKTCYNSPELLELFNKYKFIITFENSHTAGYITEKIFNVFLARSIPIYDGAPNISEFIKPGSFIPFTENIINIINMVNNNEEMYNKIINMDKVQDKYKDIKVRF